MKKLISGMLFVAAMGISLTGSIANAQGMGGDGSQECKVEVISCAWWSSDTRQICHENGNGLVCAECGSSTTCP